MKLNSQLILKLTKKFQKKKVSMSSPPKKAQKKEVSTATLQNHNKKSYPRKKRNRKIQSQSQKATTLMKKK